MEKKSSKSSFYFSALLFLALIASLAMPMQTVLATPATTVVYDAVPNPLPPNMPSQPFQAGQASEFGDYVHLAGTNRILQTVTVTMSDWALYSDYSSDIRYSADSVNWTHPITLNIYNVVTGAPNTVGSLLATVTQTSTIPWRPAGDPTCPDTGYGAGFAWRAGDSNCYNGLAFNLTFDLSSLNVTLPNDIIVGVAFNTQSWGAVPIGSNGPYNSLNVGAVGTATIGTDDNTDKVFFNSLTPGQYGDGGAGGTGIFREDINWTPYGTVPIQITVAPDCTGTLDCYVDAVSGNDANGGASIADAKKTIQAAVDAVGAGGTVHVLPGVYSETASGRTLTSIGGTYTFGLFISDAKSGITIQGVDGSDNPITSYAGALATINTNATNDFGPSGIFVEGDNVTIAGVKVGTNSTGQNKTIEVIGNNFALKNSDIADPQGSVYINDFRFDTGTNTSHVKAYLIEGNYFQDGISLDIASGAGFSGPVSGRVIKDNVFANSYYWPSISFNGSGTTVPWFVYSVGGAVIKGNTFNNTYVNTGGVNDLKAADIRARGDYDNTQFDWTSYWNDNTFNKAVVTLDGVYPPFNVREYSYTDGDTFNHVRRIGPTIQGGVDNTVAGDTVLVKAGTYDESPLISTSLTLLGESGRNATFIGLQTGPTYLGALTINAPTVTIDGFTIIGRDGTSSTIASTNIMLNTTAESVIVINNKLRVGKADAVNTTGDDGFGLITTYDTSSDVNSLIVTNNLFEPLNTEGTRAFYINPGVNSFVFRGNEITGRFARTAITQAKDGLVEENLVNGVGAAGSRSAGFGTWGYPDPTVYGHTTFRNNEITGVSIGVAIFETESVIVENNIFSQIGSAVRVVPNTPLTFNLSTIQISLNSITNSDAEGVLKDVSLSGIVAGQRNWWGSSSGPTHASNPSGTGEDVGNDVDFTPWLCDGTDTDPAIGFQPNLTNLCPTIKVHVAKYLNGIQADVTSAGGYQFPMIASWSAANIGSGSGNYVLGNGHGSAPLPYQADTSPMTVGADYTTSEVTSGDSKVRLSCGDGAIYRLVGYKTSLTSFADAFENGALTTVAPAFTGLTTDQYIVVLNEKCPTLTVVKVLIPNTDSGKFNLTIGGTAYATNVGDGGTTGAVALNAGMYTVGETAGTGTSLTEYLTTIGGDCALDGTVTLAFGENKTCTITNTKVNANPAIALNKQEPVIADASSPLTYTYLVTNPGNVPLSNVGVSDNKCAPVNYSSGDDGNNLLDLTETWTFTCTYTQSFTSSKLTNKTTVTGKYGNTTYTATDSATLYPFTLNKKIYLYWDERSSRRVVYSQPDNTPFTVEIYKNNILISTITISQDAPAKLWLSNGEYTFKEVSVPSGYLAVVSSFTYTTTGGHGFHNSCNDDDRHDDACDDGKNLNKWTFPNVITYNLAIDKTGPTTGRKGKMVTYNYTVTNSGPASVMPKVTDDKCKKVTYVSGDTDHDKRVDPGETWIFKCDYKVNGNVGSQITNTATVTDAQQPKSWGIGGDTVANNNKDTWTLTVIQ